MHYQFNVKVVHTLTHLILPGHPTLPFEGFRGKYSVGQAHTYPCGQVYDFDRLVRSPTQTRDRMGGVSVLITTL